MAAALDESVLYGAVAEAISQTPSEVRVRFSGPSGQRQLSCDRVVVTVPLPVLRHISFSPRLSQEKEMAIEAVRYAAVTRVFLQVGSRFWERDGLSGFAVTDHPLEIFHASFGQTSNRGILLGYLHESLARKVDELGRHEGIDYALNLMCEAFPGLQDEVQRTEVFSWDAEPWARGAVALWKPGDIRTHYPHVSIPEGRIHFGGEHCSPWHSWMQGAIHSGVRAALEVVA